MDSGIIPARAGFTLSGGVVWVGGWDHPRSRGVYAIAVLLFFMALGSSPLARGLPNLAVGLTVRERIIPARAGFTENFGVPATKVKDHPRSRGVYADPENRSRVNAGSSPLARGLRCHYYS